MSERVTALARHDFPERPHQNAHLDCLVSVSFSHSHSIIFLFITFSHAPFRPPILPVVALHVLFHSHDETVTDGDFTSTRAACQVETEGLRRSIQNLGVLLTTAAVAHTSVATGEGLRHAATGQHHTVTVTTKDKVRPFLNSSVSCVGSKTCMLGKLETLNRCPGCNCTFSPVLSDSGCRMSCDRKKI